MDPDFVDAICRNANNPDNIKSVNPYNPDNLEEVSRNQIAAIHRFLVAEVTPFASNLVADAQLKNMLNKQGNIIYGKLSYAPRENRINCVLKQKRGQKSPNFYQINILVYAGLKMRSAMHHLRSGKIWKKN